jgi:hypothetical protein
VRPGYRIKLHQEGRWLTAEGVDCGVVDPRKVLRKQDGVMDNCSLSEWPRESGDAWIPVTNPTLGVGFGLDWEVAFALQAEFAAIASAKRAVAG